LRDHCVFIEPTTFLPAFVADLTKRRPPHSGPAALGATRGLLNRHALQHAARQSPHGPGADPGHALKEPAPIPRSHHPSLSHTPPLIDAGSPRPDEPSRPGLLLYRLGGRWIYSGGCNRPSRGNKSVRRRVLMEDPRPIERQRTTHGRFVAFRSGTGLTRACRSGPCRI
jgi:hypothetical protein